MNRKHTERWLTRAAVAMIFAVCAIGAAPCAAGAAAYDLGDNPFRYNGEYRDRTCSADYLRARWYLPETQTFLSRDPVDPVHRYGYTAGNPIGRSDPSGLYSLDEFTRDVTAAVHRMAPGSDMYWEPVIPILGQVLSGMQLLANLPSFWHPTVESVSNFAFLVVGVAGEGATSARYFDRLPRGGERFWDAFHGRLALDTILGVGQSASTSMRHGRFDTATFLQGVELTAANVFYGRLTLGLGYRPFSRTAAEVDRSAVQFFNPADRGLQIERYNQVLVYRMAAKPYTSPVLEFFGKGRYEEKLVTVGRLEVKVGRSLEVINGERTMTSVREYGFVPGFGGGQLRTGEFAGKSFRTGGVGTVLSTDDLMSRTPKHMKTQSGILREDSELPGLRNDVTCRTMGHQIANETIRILRR